ncbi:MAG: gliding motility-associated C-terminal domain-containing protein, partial [Bacteroidota bacterium]
NHLDLDSDNDAILDVIEAGHFAPDTDGNGIIDGEPVVFGANGWFNSLASDPDATDAEANYQLRDKDRDNYPDIHDLDSDNDGIHDIAEANRGDLDANDNGRIDFLNIGSLGLAAAIDPQQTGIPVSLPSNTDGDSYADYLDLDSDNDGLNDVTEGGGIDLDDDGILGSEAVSVDDNGRVFSDFIGIALVTTSFPLHSDRDMLPDYLDLDSDNDGINDVAEILKEDPDEDGRIGTGAVRVNINGQAFDNEVLTTSIAFDFDIDMLPNYRDLDSDNDGINDVEEATIFTLDFDNNGRVTAGTPETNVLGQPVELDSVLTTSIPIDSDGDGVADYLDLDVDNDGILDTREADFPDADADGRVGEGTVLVNDNGQVILTADASTIATSNPIDWDIDGVRDYRDLDSDNDGIHDVEETRQPDPDNDGRVGTSDLGTDTNGRVQSAEEQNVLLTTTMLKDTDSDAVMDWRDLDSDNDGINDVEEAGLHDPDDDGFVGEGITLVNRYGQAVEAENENVFATTSQPNDNDSDGIPDYNDLDTDNDGINDVAEAGHSDPDNDGFINENIPAVNTYGQAIINPFLVTAIGNSTPPDTDGDGQRDYRDLDSDNDGISDVVEGNNLDPDDNNLVGTGSPDVNNLGQPTGTDAIPTNNTSDPIDTDQDGIPDFRDLDSDEDGLTDSDECPDDNTCRDGDADGQFDYRDRDRDNDGIDDNWECANGGTNGTCPDTDGDGIPDVDDLDTDNDGIPDEEECANNGPCPDIDGDGIPEWQDTNCNADALPVLSPTAVAAFCAGDILVLSATNSNPQGDRLTYRWTSPDGTVFTAEDDANGNFMLTVVDAQPSNTGIYTLQVFAEDGCPSERVEVEVTVYPQPEQPVLSVASAEVCLGQEILLSTDDAGDDISYAWYRIRMTDTVLVDMTTEPFLSLAAKLENSGAYYVQTATPTSACLSDLSATQTVTVVELAELEVGNSTSLQQSACEGDAFRLTATNYENATYQWTGPDGFTSDEREPLIENATGEQAGIYALTVTVETCDVVFSGQTTVYVTRNIQPELINLSGQVCEGERIELVVDNSLLILEGSRIRFEWYNDADEQVAVTNSPFLRLENITVEQSGSIYLLVYVNDCVFTASAPIAIEVIASDSEMAEVNQSTYTICGDEEVNLEAVAPQDVNTTGRWETDSPIASIMDANSPTTTVFDLPEGVTTFTWVLTNERCGTSSEASVTVTKEIAVEVKDDSTQIDMNQIAQIDLLENDKLGNALYTFGILDQPQRGTVELMDGIATYTPAENYFGMDNFTYQICNERCPEVCTVATVKIEIIFTQFGDDRCFLPNTITPNRDGKNDAFVVPCLERDFTNNRIAIFNRWGDEVFATEQYRNDWEGTHQGKNLPPGTYFYILQLDRNSSESIQGYFTLVR